MRWAWILWYLMMGVLWTAVLAVGIYVVQLLALRIALGN